MSRSKRNRSARPTRIGGFAKGVESLGSNSDAMASQTLVLLLRALLLLRWHQDHLLLATRSRYIDTSTSRMSTLGGYYVAIRHVVLGGADGAPLERHRWCSSRVVAGGSGLRRGSCRRSRRSPRGASALR